MALELITADERLSDANNKTSLAIFGRQKIGKTSLVMTCDPAKTLFVNMEAGMKSVQSWTGPDVPIRTYADAKDLACMIGGVDPAAHNGVWNERGKVWDMPYQAYSQTHYNQVAATYMNTRLGQWWGRQIGKRPMIFFDSISDLTKLAMTWTETQPEAFSERSGKRDIRGQYGLLARDIIKMLRHIQHAPGVDVVFIGGLDDGKDDSGRDNWAMQTEGRKISQDIPYIVDQIITFSDFDYVQGTGFIHNLGKGQHRAFCCKAPNPWGLPAGDRSGVLDLIEEPHLGKLMAKINSAGARTLESLNFSLPAQT